MLVRTWNLFHGNTLPPGRKRYVEEMVRLVTQDEPDAVCLQEVPPWSLGRLGEWSGMAVFGEVASRPSLGPIPVTRGIGRWVTDHNAGLFRSGFEGQANAILVRRPILARHVVTLNPVAFRLRAARRLGLSPLTKLAWGKERRQALAVVGASSRWARSELTRLLPEGVEGTGWLKKRIPSTAPSAGRANTRFAS